MKLSDDLVWRGLIKDKTFGENEWLDEPKVFYHGVDASADSLTIGNLAALMLARRLVESGWRAILLVGGATSLIGDPGGKESERQLKTRQEIIKNTAAIKAQIAKLFAGQKFTLVDNYDWFSDVTYLDFLRDVGKHFSMTELMQRDFVSARMGEQGSGISYAEFSYSLIQGYDFWELYKQHQTVLQIGGSDQWGNMLSGVALVRKKESKQVHALSMPLVVDKTTGNKFGKTESGAVWLDSSKTSPTQFSQFWMTADDVDVAGYLKIFTMLPKDRIEQVMGEHQTDPSKRLAQKTLADEVVRIVHGPEPSLSASQTTQYLTGQVSMEDATEVVLTEIRKEIPAIRVASGSSIVGALVASGLAQSNSDARRLLGSGAVYINNQPVSRENFETSDFKNNRLLMRRGKAYKDSALVELE